MDTPHNYTWSGALAMVKRGEARFLEPGDIVQEGDLSVALNRVDWRAAPHRCSTHLGDNKIYCAVDMGWLGSVLLPDGNIRDGDATQHRPQMAFIRPYAAPRTVEITATLAT